MTSKDKLYEWICYKTEHDEKGFSFEEIDKNMETYFEKIEMQSTLAEYDINNKFDIEKFMEKYFDEDLLEIEKVCIIAFLEGMSKIKEERKEQAMQGESGVREYIYNF